jgi:WD40 repeat protein
MILCCVLLAPLLAAADDAAPAPAALPVAELKRDAPVSFEKEILPILSTSCLACHNRTKAKADLVLETPTDILKGGESGPAVVPKKADESLLLKVTAHRQEPVMPPKGNKVAAADLTPEQLGLLKLWIDEGATGTIGGASVPTVEWQPVPAGLNSIYAVALTGDGRYAAASRGNQVHVYQLPTGRLVARLTDARLAPQAGAAHHDLVQSLAFSPDGSLLASGAYREVKLWRRPRDARRLSVTSAARGAVNAVDVSPDGSTFVTAGADGVVRLWGANDGRPVREFAGHGGPVTSVRFSPDGAKLASASSDKTLRVWAVADGAAFAQAPTLAEPAAVAWTAGGKAIAGAGADGVVRVWDLPNASGGAFTSPKELKGHDGPVLALSAVTSQPTHLVSGGGDGTVRQWDVQSGQAVRQFSHGVPVAAVAVRSDGKRIASAGPNGVKLWDRDGKLLAELKGDRSLIDGAVNRERDLAFAASEVAYHKANADAANKRSADQVERVKKAAAADVEADKALVEKQKGQAEKQKALADKQQAKASEAEVKKAEADAKAADAEVKKAQTAKAAAADELRLAITSAQGAADAAAEALAAHQAAGREHKQIESELPALKATAAAAEKPVRAVAFSTDNHLLAVGGDDQAVRIYSADTGAACDAFRGHQGPVTSLAFAGADAILSGGADGAAIAWDLAPQWTLDRQLGTGDSNSPFADRVTALDFTPDGRWLATGGGVPSRDGEALLWEIATGSLARRFEALHSDGVLAVDVSADGKLLATAAADRFMKVSELGTGRLVKSFEGHTGHVLGVAFQRAGRILATAAADNTVKVWDLDSGEQKKAIAGHDKEITSVRFVGDTDHFLITAGDGRVRLLRPDGGEVRSFPGSAGFVYAAAATRDGSVIVAGGEDGVLRVWHGATGQPVATLAPPDAAR